VPEDPFKLPVAKGKYLAGRTRRDPRRLLQAHLKYAQYRQLGPQERTEDRTFFNAEGDNIPRQDILHDIMQHHSPAVRYHKIVLSPAEYEHIDDYRAWTRAIMHDLERQKGMRLHWYAIIHAHERQHTNTPHVHLVLAGAGEDRDSGEQKTVRMDWNVEYAAMRISGREHSNFELYRQIEQTIKELEQEEAHTREPVQSTPDYQQER
jgi:hypothetical protein